MIWQTFFNDTSETYEIHITKIKFGILKLFNFQLS